MNMREKFINNLNKLLKNKYGENYYDFFHLLEKVDYYYDDKSTHHFVYRIYKYKKVLDCINLVETKSYRNRLQDFAIDYQYNCNFIPTDIVNTLDYLDKVIQYHELEKELKIQNTTKQKYKI